MKIVFSGGGTLGPVTPLLAIREAIASRYSDVQFVWVGTKNGPEKEIVKAAGIPFFTIGAGKWRRYFSIWNLFDIFKILIAFWQSLYFLVKETPDILVTAGGFVSVPLHWAGFLLGIPNWVHQQDIKLGLANKLMFPIADKITTALQDTTKNLPSKKTEWIGNPSRNLFGVTKEAAKDFFGIPTSATVIFALGGGTGSDSINKMIIEALPHWPNNWHVLHLAGKERPHELSNKATGVFLNYHVYDFFAAEMKYAYAAADVVIARAGFGTLTELAALKKAAIILPMFDTHQEDNAKFFANQGGVIMLDKWSNNGLGLAQIVKDIMGNPEKRLQLGQNFHNLLPTATFQKIIDIFDKITKR